MSNFLDKIDGKIMEAKIDQSIDMLKNKNPDEISKKIAKIDKDELMKKLDEFDEKKIKELNIDLDKIKKKINEEDIKKAKALAGKDGEVIINKLLNILNQGGNNG